MVIQMSNVMKLATLILMFVFFGTAKTYRYSYASAGEHHVEQMKVLAQNGCGLNSYIMRNVRFSYEK